MNAVRLLIAGALFCLYLYYPSGTSLEPRYRLADSEERTDLSLAQGHSISESVLFRYTPRAGLNYEVRVPEQYESQLGYIVNQLMATHIGLERRLGKIYFLDVKVQVLSPKDFSERTGAPEWVSAMYYDDTILIPIDTSVDLDLEALAKTVRHEYTHAALDVLTDGNCPGWLEEGIAQQQEGGDVRAVQDAFYRWARVNGPLQIARLQGGFTRLADKEVPAAYGQSLFMTEILTASSEAHALRELLNQLKSGSDIHQALFLSFGLHVSDLERETHAKLEQVLSVL